jgi:hypothetical protein
MQGAARGFEHYVQLMWQDVLSLLVVETSAGHRLGIAVAYAANFRDGHVKMAAISDEAVGRGSLFLEGASLFIEHVFSVFPFRKLYAEGAVSAIGNRPQEMFVEEGRLRNHCFVDGRWEDFVTYALYREDWSMRDFSTTELTRRIRGRESKRPQGGNDV